jgi:hypothetical protein
MMAQVQNCLVMEVSFPFGGITRGGVNFARL